MPLSDYVKSVTSCVNSVLTSGEGGTAMINSKMTPEPKSLIPENDLLEKCISILEEKDIEVAMAHKHRSMRCLVRSASFVVVVSQQTQRSTN